MTEWLHTSRPELRAASSRLIAFRAAHPGVEVSPREGFWAADYRSPDGRIAFKACHELPQLLDELEQELR